MWAKLHLISLIMNDYLQEASLFDRALIVIVKFVFEGNAV